MARFTSRADGLAQLGAHSWTVEVKCDGAVVSANALEVHSWGDGKSIGLLGMIRPELLGNGSSGQVAVYVTGSKALPDTTTVAPEAPKLPRNRK